MRRRLFFGFIITSLISACVFAAVKIKPHVYPSYCVGCGDCVRVCPKAGKAIRLVRGKAIIVVDECIACYKCVEICSYGAVRQ